MAHYGCTYKQAIELLQNKKPDINGTRKHRIAHETYLVKYDGIDAFYVEYHKASVVILHKNGKLDIAHCGYRTRTTKVRINEFLSATNAGCYVYQQKGNWYVTKRSGIEPNNKTQDLLFGSSIRVCPKSGKIIQR